MLSSVGIVCVLCVGPWDLRLGPVNTLMRWLSAVHSSQTNSCWGEFNQLERTMLGIIFRSDSDQIFGENNFEQLCWESLTCWTEAASAQGSLPRVSSLGVSFGGLNFIPTLLLAPAEELDLQMILDPLSLLVDTILTVSTLRPPNCAPLSSWFTLYSMHVNALRAIRRSHRVTEVCSCWPSPPQKAEFL